MVSLRLRPKIEALDSVDSFDPIRPEPVRLLEQPGHCSYQRNLYKFANAFPPPTRNRAVFEAHREHVLNVVNGYDCTLMCYGQTGSGKTHTMMGQENEPG